MFLRSCQSCGGKTRVDPKQLVEDVRCDGCKDPLPPPGEFMPVDLRGLKDAGEATKVPILLLFAGERCQASRVMRKHLDKLAEKYVSKALFFEIIVEQQPEVIGQMGIQGTPTLMLGKRGALLHRHDGVVDGSIVEKWIREAQRM